MAQLAERLPQRTLVRFLSVTLVDPNWNLANLEDDLFGLGLFEAGGQHEFHLQRVQWNAEEVVEDGEAPLQSAVKPFVGVD